MDVRRRCPWCVSRTGSKGKRPFGGHVSISLEKGVYKCWRCGKTGRLNKYVCKILEIDEIYINPHRFQAEEEERSDTDLPDGYVPLFPADEVKGDISLLPYLRWLHGRGIPPGHLGRFKVGCVIEPEEKTWRQGFLVFPLLDPEFSGFVLRKTPMARFQKCDTYINSKGLGKLQGALYNGRLLSSDLKKIYVVEGAIDSIRMRNRAVATLGVDLSNKQLDRLAAFPGRVIFCGDGDAWRESMACCRRLVLRGKDDSRWVKLPAGTDPGQLGWEGVSLLPTRK